MRSVKIETEIKPKEVMMKRAVVILIAFLVVVISIGVGLYIGIPTYVNYSLTQTGEKTGAEVVNVLYREDSPDLIDIEYVVDGKTYEGRYQGSARTGDEVTIFYDRDNPQRHTESVSIINVFIRFLPVLIGPAIVAGFVVVMKKFGLTIDQLADSIFRKKRD